MNAQEISAASEDDLLREASSLGEILERIRGRIPSALIDGPAWSGLVERARELTAAMAAFPFGFELPLHDPRPRADFGVSVNGGSRTAATLEEAGRSEGAAAHVAGIAGLLAGMTREDSPLRIITDWELMLEYDIDPARAGAKPEPGFFLGTIGRPLAGDRAERRFADIGVLLDAVEAAARWGADPAERRQVERVYRALTPDTRIETFGAFPARGRSVRLAVKGFRKTSDVMAFLERADWSGSHPAVAAMASRLEARGVCSHMGIHLDVGPGGLGPALGLSLFTRDEKPRDGRYWLDKPAHWTALIEELRAQDLAVSDKLSALAGWPGADVLHGRSGVFVLIRGLHHFKLVLTGERFEQAKAYAYLFLRSMPKRGEPPG